MYQPAHLFSVITQFLVFIAEQNPLLEVLMQAMPLSFITGDPKMGSEIPEGLATSSGLFVGWQDFGLRIRSMSCNVNQCR